MMRSPAPDGPGSAAIEFTTIAKLVSTKSAGVTG
jgi:hypothetical protein